MTIVFSEALTAREGLQLHDSIGRFSNQGPSIALMTAGRPKVTYLGQTYKNIQALTEKLNTQFGQVAGGGFAGIAGKHILSCHFTDKAYGQFKEFSPVPVNNFVVQLSGKNDYFYKAVASWAERYNRELDAADAPIRLERALTDNPDTVNIILPNLESLQAFEFQMRRHAFDVQARAIMHRDAGVQLDQRPA